MSCGGGTTGNSSNPNCLVSLNGTCLISGGSSQPSQPQSSNCPANYTPSLFGCQPPASNTGGGVTAGGSCSNGQVPASQIGIASGVCVNPNSSTSSGGPPPLQTKSCPGYAQQFPIAQNCPTQLPSSGSCDIGVRLSVDAQVDTAVSQACGTNPDTHALQPPTPCDTGIAYPPAKCVACDDGSTAPGRDQCPPGTMQTPCSAGQGVAPPGQACTECFDNSLAYPPTACPKPPPPPAPSPSPSPSSSSGSSTTTSACDFAVRMSLDEPQARVSACGDAGTSSTTSAQPTASGNVDFSVTCLIPGPPPISKQESAGDCILDGGDWNAAANSNGGSNTTANSGGSPGAGTGVTQDLQNQCIAIFGPFGCATVDLGQLAACVKSKSGGGISQTSNVLVICGIDLGVPPLPGTDIPNAGG
jgi:hypothetical protein